MAQTQNCKLVARNVHSWEVCLVWHSIRVGDRHGQAGPRNVWQHMQGLPLARICQLSHAWPDPGYLLTSFPGERILPTTDTTTIKACLFQREERLESLFTLRVCLCVW